VIMSELIFQKQIIDDAKEFDKRTFGLKMNHRFVSGIPDIILKVPNYEVLFIEAKMIRLTSKGVINVNTTDIQRATMRLMARAGFRVEVWVAVSVVDKQYLVRTAYNSTTLHIDECELIERPRGKKWPIQYLLEHPVGASHLDT
jgi:hypothetical protein